MLSLERVVDETVSELKRIRDITDAVLKNGELEEDAWNTLEEVHATVDNLLWPG